jgi:hypothetical protein
MRITVRPIGAAETGPDAGAGVATSADGATADDLLTLSLTMNLEG